MTVSAQIRKLAEQGLSTADIARELSLRYQHVYNVLAKSGLIKKSKTALPTTRPKPLLRAETLLSGGFSLKSSWVTKTEAEVVVSSPLPKKPAVYAFVLNGTVMYVGVATKSVAQRLAQYSRPGPSQVTNQRINALVKQYLSDGVSVDILLAHPEDLEWNGLPVDACAGLEMGIIKTYQLEWNIRSAG